MRFHQRVGLSIQKAKRGWSANVGKPGGARLLEPEARRRTSFQAGNMKRDTIPARRTRGARLSTFFGLFDSAEKPGKGAEAIQIKLKGEAGERDILPRFLWHGCAPSHKAAQWFLRAADLAKGKGKEAERDFAVADLCLVEGHDLKEAKPEGYEVLASCLTNET